MPHQSTKTYGHEIGLSCAFRQWRADSHCKFLHGYALAVTITFEANVLDERGWVIDFGGLGDLKEEIKRNFDHKTLVALDDPHINWYKQGLRMGTMDIILVKRTGCESFAAMIYDMAAAWLNRHNQNVRCRVVSVKVEEHGANSATYIG